MKKIIALLLTLVLTFSVVACGKTSDNNENNTPAANNETKDSAENNTPETEGNTEAPSTGDASVAQTLVSEFLSLTADTTLDAQAIADALIGTEVLSPVAMITMPMEEGLLSGFDNYEVKGFTECVTFAPMIGGAIAFVGYVFTVGDGVDANAFASDLEANANLRWNICVTADEVVTAVDGNKVMFVMAPMSFDTETPSDMIQEDAVDMVFDDEIPAFDGEMAE